MAVQGVTWPLQRRADLPDCARWEASAGWRVDREQSDTYPRASSLGAVSRSSGWIYRAPGL